MLAKHPNFARFGPLIVRKKLWTKRVKAFGRRLSSATVHTFGDTKYNKYRQRRWLKCILIAKVLDMENIISRRAKFHRSKRTVHWMPSFFHWTGLTKTSLGSDSLANWWAEKKYINLNWEISNSRVRKTNLRQALLRKRKRSSSAMYCNSCELIGHLILHTRNEGVVFQWSITELAYILSHDGYTGSIEQRQTLSKKQIRI